VLSRKSCLLWTTTADPYRRLARVLPRNGRTGQDDPTERRQRSAAGQRRSGGLEGPTGAGSNSIIPPPVSDAARQRYTVIVVEDPTHELARKLNPARFTGMSAFMAAIVGYVLDESFTEPQIAEISVSESENLVYVRRSDAPGSMASRAWRTCGTTGTGY